MRRVSKNHFEIAKLLLEHGANPNAGVDSSECCLTIGSIYHGDQAKHLQKLLRQYGAYIPPYRMNAEQMKRAIRSSIKLFNTRNFSAMCSEPETKT
jgi:ankyrin repeat protein